MRHLLSRQVLFFGGKGGVGKTTCASATALGASRAGKRVLLVSTDPAHSTSDMFGTPFGDQEREIQPSLFGVEIDPAAEARRYIEDVKTRATALFGGSSIGKALRQIDLAASMPGIEEAALFDRVSRLVAERSTAYDLVIFDTAPTGHTLQLLRTPEAMTAWLRALAASRRAMLPDDRRDTDQIVATLEDRVARLDQFRTRLTSRATTAFVLVLIPERLPIDETARAAEQLADAGIDIGSVVVNRVLPDNATGEFVEARRRQERLHLAEIDRRFAGYRLTHVAQQPTDVHGLEALGAVAHTLSAS
jgi:arsenite/tail-anchored protein-transporting ATPase